MLDNVFTYHSAISERGLEHLSCPNIVFQTLGNKKGEDQKFFLLYMQFEKWQV